MKYDVNRCRILYKRELALGIYDFLLEADEMAKIAQPGQFVHILVPGKTLRRPISILGPLGKGFRLGDTNRKALFIGGGIGVPPLLAAARQFGKNATVALGFRNKDAAILEADFARVGCRVFVATDDGSMGHHGLVIDCAKEAEADIIFACGPTPMLKAVCQLAKKRGIPAQISLEERMACGIGACLGCATPLLREDGSQYFGHVCKDGPVFDYEKVAL